MSKNRNSDFYVELAGSVMEKWDNKEWSNYDLREMHKGYFIRISNTIFEMPKTFFNSDPGGIFTSLVIGDEVVFRVKRSHFGAEVAGQQGPTLLEHLSRAKVVTIRRGTSSTAQQVSAVELLGDQQSESRQQWPVERYCAALRNLGAEAQILDGNPFTGALGGVWIQIFDGPIKWVERGIGTIKGKDKRQRAGEVRGRGHGSLCYVQDTRIIPDSPQLWLVSVRIKSFPLFGSMKEVRWVGTEDLQGNKDFSIHISERLHQNQKVTDAISSADTEICIRTDPENRCWIVAADDRPTREWTKQLWDCCQTVAEALLATPTGEQ